MVSKWLVLYTYLPRVINLLLDLAVITALLTLHSTFGFEMHTHVLLIVFLEVLKSTVRNVLPTQFFQCGNIVCLHIYLSSINASSIPIF